MKEIESSHDDILVEPMSSFTKYSLLILREVLLVYLKLQLIQVMVPESLVINSDIDEFYKHWYLHRQHHFSLEQLINSPVKRLAVYICPVTKLINYVTLIIIVHNITLFGCWSEITFYTFAIVCLGNNVIYIIM